MATGDGPITVTLDWRGLKCPLPVLKSRKAVTRLSPGTSVEILTTDPLAGIDIPHFCHEDGHRLIESERLADGHRFVVELGGSKA